MLLTQQKDFADTIRLKILQWEQYPGLSKQALHAIISILISGRQRDA